jgi:Rrf2 family protein
MKITKKMQYGLLLVLYLTRSGRSTVETVATELSISLSFLEQIANTLRKANVLLSVRGPAGGYEIIGDPTVIAVLKPLQGAISYPGYSISKSSEKRALGNLLRGINDYLTPLLSRKVRSLTMELAAKEVAVLSQLNETNPVN